MIPNIELTDSTLALQRRRGMLEAANLQAVADRLIASDLRCHAIGAKMPTRCPPVEVPAVKLVSRSPVFARDLLDLGFRFVSARLRDALQASADDVHYLAVDATACPPEMRALDYRVIHVALYANPIDMERTEGFVLESQAPDGTSVQVWHAGSATPPNPNDTSPPRPIYLRADFEPPGPIFAIPGDRVIMVSDEIAERVMRGGMRDVMFYDPYNRASDGGLRKRRL